MNEFTATPVQLDTEAELDAFIERHETPLVEFYTEAARCVRRWDQYSAPLRGRQPSPLGW